MGSILVTGGAGYIGSHLVRRLAAEGADVVVFDDLSAGHPESLPGGVEHINGDLTNFREIEAVFKKRDFEGIFHFGAVALVGESIRNPEKYYKINIEGGLNLLNAAVSGRVPASGHIPERFVFSSSCAVYGIPEKNPISEDCPRPAPINPYGWTKLFFEKALAAFQEKYGFSAAFLRYFCAAGADMSGEFGEDHDPETHLIPLVVKTALGQREKIQIFGTDYPTRDGSAIRDYIHVDDLASAHLAVYRALADSGRLIYNLGSESGFSVREIIASVRKVTGRDFRVEEAAPREGDPPELVADSALIKKELGWQCERSLEDIIKSACLWHERHPEGYKSKE